MIDIFGSKIIKTQNIPPTKRIGKIPLNVFMFSEDFESKLDEKTINATYTVSPIIVNGDTVGIVMIFSTDKEVDDIDYKIVQIASKFLTSHLE